MKQRFIYTLLLLQVIHLAYAQDKDIAFTADTVLGTYADKNKKEYVIGRSFTRYFFYQPQSSSVRGLFRVNDTSWFSGPGLLIDSPKIESIRFANGKLIIEKGVHKTEAVKSARYTDVPVSFKSGSLTLKGTLLLPSVKRKCPAVVMVHGSGEQMRHGYASYIRIIADHLAKNGIAVLTYDKRGCGESEGNYKTASFQDLANDALAGLAFLKTQSQIDVKHIGLGGSSQAGWIIAKATEMNQAIPFVFCISGGGMGFTAARQNSYNLRTELSAAAFNETLIDSVMQSLELMYRYVQSGTQTDAAALDQLITKLSSNKLVVDYLPPSSKQMNPTERDQWFYALEINYNPLPAWRKYKGKLLSIFGELDASTPVSEVIPLLKEARKQKPTTTDIILYPAASHLILRASKKTDDELPLLTEFEPLFLPQLFNWIAAITNLDDTEISAVKKVERKWLDMYEKNDYENMRNVLHANFSIMYSNGLTHSKQQLLKNGVDNPVPKGYRIYTINSNAQRLAGKVIVSGIVVTEYPEDGMLKKIYEQYTDIYVKENGSYKVLSSKLSIQMPDQN